MDGSTLIWIAATVLVFVLFIVFVWHEIRAIGKRSISGEDRNKAISKEEQKLEQVEK